ncbi:MAG TPA: amino acid adenylation domain-containing protein [Pyrinomonadaceae bacterium]|nr:amino acid adenylation domain-containing protein [Pyrinomonadaceae bacterium]
MNSADNIQAIYSLSPLQEGMLFHTVADPASGVYVEQSSFTLGGDLDIQQFRAAWQSVINRHAVLRTSFVWRGLERMAQVVFRDTEAPLRTADWRGLDASEQETALRAYLEADRREGFDLAKAPLLRLFLVRLNEGQHQFVISYHHALLDGWSYMMLLKEMAHTYEALMSGTELRLPEPRQYRDFIRWLEKQDNARAEAFWRKRLAGFNRATPLPLAKTTSGAQAAAIASFTDAEIDVLLPRELTTALNEFARRVRVSLNSLVQSAWSLVLARASGEEDVTFGATVAGRPAELEGVEYMVGLFINTIPIRARIDDGARLSDWLRNFQTERAADYEFQYTRLVDIQKFSALEQGRGLFDSLLVFENYPTDVFERQQQSGVEAANGARRALDIQQSTTHELVNYPLCLVACPGEELRLIVAYSSARFSRASAEQIGRWLAHVLRSFVERPHARLGDIDLVQPEEEELIRRLSQGDYATRSAADTAHKLFERHARAQGAHAAVVAGQLSISYGELNAWANRLARHLRRKARVGTEARVGIFLERGADMIAAVLAVLKAGATYVPLDPGYPAERLAYIADDCALEALITTSDIAALAPQVAAGRVVELDTDASEIERQEASDLEPDIHTESLAYVIYTSGSTGKPKGTGISHAALAAHCRGWADFCALTPHDRVLQFASLSFDASVEQIFPTLATGATLVVRERQPWSTLEFARNAADFGLTVVDLPAAFFAECTRNWHQLAPYIAQSPLRLIAAGGDRVSAEGAALWREVLPSVRLVNAYGPTEATVTATGGDISVDAGHADNVPIGRPLDNRTVYVLDARMRLAPFDVAGELYLGGEALARGYWNRAVQTALSFVPDPFSAAPGARLYRTGDRARLRRDGALEFLGRADDQLKIRGYRVEPREVELACEEHASVARCLALPYEGTAGRELAAYVVARGGEHALDEGDLRAHLARRLPRYSIPQSIIFLEAFPMLPNDRIDRQRLPAPASASAPEGLGARIAPRNAYEEMLAELWADVLSCEPPGVTDDFFLTGGHSLDATRLASRVYDTFGVELPLRTIFEQPTVAELAATIAELQSASLAQEDAEFLDELEAIS